MPNRSARHPSPLALAALLAGCHPGVRPPDGPDSGDSEMNPSHDSGVETIPPAPGPWLRQEVEAPGSATFTELSYHPREGEDPEWIELHNPMALDLDLSGWALEGGVDFGFPEGTVVPAGGYLVVATDPAALEAATGFSGALGPWEGKLANGGERIDLRNNAGRRIDTIGYGDDDPWPVQADGSGHTLVKRQADAASDHAENWGWSSEPKGTPGAANQVAGAAESTLVLNEIAAAGEDPFWVELLDNSLDSLGTAGLTLASSTGRSLALPSETLAPGDLLELPDLGFPVAEGDVLFLYAEDGDHLLDAVRVQAAPRARTDGGGPWRTPGVATPGDPNAIDLCEEVVIAEVQYHAPPISREGLPVTARDEEWIELYNRGGDPVDLGGWMLVDAVAFTFPAGTVMAPGARVVVANDAAAMRAAHPDITVLGDFSGRLDNGGERILLLDALGNPADEVRYSDGGRWPTAADGGGSSLELRDPWADNAAPEAWAASDERARTAWAPYSYRGVAEPSAVGPDGVWNELVLGLLDTGEVLIDDLHVIRDPDTARVELLRNGGFDAGSDHWRLLGDHRHSEVVPDPDDPENPVLRLVATGPTGHMHDHAETTLTEAIGSREYEISFRARWVSGSNQLNSRLYFDRMPRTTLLAQPELSGTPGEPNSTAVDDLGPTFGDLAQDAAVPAPQAPVLLTLPVDDPDGVARVTLFSSVAGAAFTSQPMAEASPGLWQATLAGQAAGTVVQVYVEAEDQDGATATFPAAGPESRALIGFDDGQSATNGLHNLRLLMTAADADWLHDDVNVMSNDPLGATVVYDAAEVFYDVGVRLKGSERGRPVDIRVGYAIAFHDEQPFRGSHGSVHVDRSEGGYLFGQREVLLNLVATRAGTVFGEYNDLIQLIAPRSAYTGPAELQLDRFSDLVLASQFTDGDEGTRFEYELIYYPYTTDDGTPEGQKLPQPDGVVGTALTDLGDDKEAYRWTFLIGNNEREDDYDALIGLCQAFSLTGSSFLDACEALIDVDQWLRTFAFATLSGTTDQYGGAGSQHNAQFYLRPEDGRMLYFPHDLDYFSSSTMAVVGNADLARLIADPVHLRTYYGHLQDIIAHAYNTSWLEPWCDQLGALLPGQDFASHCRFVDDRADWVLSGSPDAVLHRFPRRGFAITTNGGADFTASSATVDLEGQAWIDVRAISLAGAPLEITWRDATTWQVTVPLEPGPNDLTLVATDLHGTPVGADSIAVTCTTGG